MLRRLACREARRRHLLVLDGQGATHRLEIGGTSEPVKGMVPSDIALEWTPDLRFVVVAEGRTIPSVVSRVNLDTGERTTITEIAPPNQAGLLNVTLFVFRENGRQYAYTYIKRVSALYLVTGLR